MNRAAKFLALGWSDRWMLMRALAALWIGWIALRVLRFDRVRSLASGQASRSNHAPSRPAPERVAWAVTAASRYVIGGSNCLLRAIATGLLLRRYGYDANLMIGVAKAPERGLAAHAWLETSGQVLIGGFELDRYVTLAARRDAAA